MSFPFQYGFCFNADGLSRFFYVMCPSGLQEIVFQLAAFLLSSVGSNTSSIDSIMGLLLLISTLSQVIPNIYSHFENGRCYLFFKEAVGLLKKSAKALLARRGRCCAGFAPVIHVCQLEPAFTR